ncbi:hypothetical protein ACE193_03960 [Bernardetia sp. OM2101]|uniref:hypothetical protein n=1 Tax=Bernardetia sp. OM2101 TaxID=3344876 RepID=UPI0035CFCAEA
MEIQQIHTKLNKQCPSNFRINEIIPFAYPYRRVRIKVIVNKSPEESIQQVYSVFLRTIKAGYNKEEQIISFLGLSKDDFILRELYFLRERGFLDFASGTWLITEQGEEFIKDNSILKILEEEEFEFLIDGITDEVLVKNFKTYEYKVESNIKKLASEINYSNRDIRLLDNRNEQLADIYKSENQGKAYLVDYDKSDIQFDSEDKEFKEFYFIEYTPTKEKENELEPYIEIRNIDKDFSKEKRLTKILSSRYSELIKKLSDSERTSIIQLQEEENIEVLKEFKPIQTEKKITETQTLSVWETQEKFEEAIKTATSKLLIESPWIKQATSNYVNSIEKALKRNVKIIIFYGIENNDNHDIRVIEKLRDLEKKYETNFYLVHLPTHFEKKRNPKMTGTHRKLVVKDNHYFIQGSFNFLSFNKEKGDKIANEESILISKDVQSKWESVLKEYQINRKIAALFCCDL